MKRYPLIIALGIALTSNILSPLQLKALPVNTHLDSVQFVPPPTPPERGAADSRSAAAGNR